MEFEGFINSLQLLAPRPIYSSKYIIMLLVISLMMIALGIATWFLMKNISKEISPYNELKNKLTSLFATAGSIGLILSFFSWQAIPYLSSRILALILAIIFLIWSLLILIYIKRNLSWELKKFKQDERYKKYLPRAKTHK